MTATKRPAFQFYPADWRKDAALQSCSLAAQGLWINLMCIAHECEPYGHLTVNGKPMTPAQIGRLTGLAAKEVEKLLKELEDAGVFARTEEGAIFSRRMVRDEATRNARANGGHAGGEHGPKGAEHGRKGGRPPKPRGDKKPPLLDDEDPPKEPPPSSSSSSSEEKHSSVPDIPDGFARFWRAWPATDRKVDKAGCLRKWSAKKLEPLADRILADVEISKQSKSWREGFEPAPSTYLNQRRWEKDETADANVDQYGIPL